MKCLIYAPLANEHRAPIFAQLTEDLTWEGCELSIILEDRFPVFVGTRYLGIAATAETICRHLPLDAFGRALYVRHSGSGADRAPPPNPARRDLFRRELSREAPDRIYVWNGGFSYQADFMEVIDDLGLRDRCRFMEVGWLDQTDYFYVDPRGVNGDASLAQRAPPPLTDDEATELDRRLHSYRAHHGVMTSVPKAPEQILIPLQVDTDTNVQRHSPFADMREFLAFLQDWLPEGPDIIVRPHPKADYGYDLAVAVGRFNLRADGDLHRDLSGASMVVGINSTVLIQALVYDCAVVAFGRGVFSGTPAISAAAPDCPFVPPRPDPEAARDFLGELILRRQIPIREVEVMPRAERLISRARLWAGAVRI